MIITFVAMVFLCIVMSLVCGVSPYGAPVAEGTDCVMAFVAVGVLVCAPIGDDCNDGADVDDDIVVYDSIESSMMLVFVSMG